MHGQAALHCNLGHLLNWVHYPVAVLWCRDNQEDSAGGDGLSGEKVRREGERGEGTRKRGD